MSVTQLQADFQLLVNKPKRNESQRKRLAVLREINLSQLKLGLSAEIHKIREGRESIERSHE